MLIYVIAAVAGCGLLLLVLRMWASAKARPVRSGGVVYETQSSKIDDYVTAADWWWPHLRVMPLFWVAAFLSGILLVLDYHFGYSRGGIYAALILGSMFAAADLAVPLIALKGDVDERRDAMSWALLVLFTAASFVVIVGSTAELSTTTGAQNDTRAISFRDTTKLLEIKQRERDSIPVDRGAQALADLAKSTEEAADREGNRTRCSIKCEDLKKAATDYRARAEEAKRKERLTAEIENLKGRMTEGAGGDQRLDSDPLATALEAMSNGMITRDQVRRFGLTVLGLLLVTGLTVLWIMIGDHLKVAIIKERARRGEIADAQREQLGLRSKYGPASAVPLLAPPDGRTTAAEAGWTINVQAQDMRKRYSNDEDLLATDALFDRLLMRADGGSVTIAALYRAYQIMVLSTDPNSRYMTQPTMAGKLIIIAQNRDDVRVTADGLVQGWLLKPNENQKKVIVNVS